jgi:hypothetical protein
MAARVVFGVLALLCGAAIAQTIFQAKGQGIVLTLYDQPCELKEVSNLPIRITWTENGKTIEGCAAIRPDAGMVVMYFKDDKTVGLAPISAFKPATGV